MNISNWAWKLERELEPCSFLMLADVDPLCVLCGKPCSLERKNEHAGPVLRVSGWLETVEYHDLSADIWRGLRLPKRDGQAVPDIPIFVTGYELIGDRAHRYLFAGSAFVGYETK